MPGPDRLDFPVLVVVAERSVRRVVSLILDELVLSHVEVPNWRAGIRLVHRVKPILIVADWDDIQGDGRELAALLRDASGKPIPLIVLSGRPDIPLVAAEIGASAGVRKPLVAGALMEAVELILQRSQA